MTMKFKLLISALDKFVVSIISLARNGMRGCRINVIRQAREKSCICIGNGPSLKKDMDEILIYMDRFDFFCVNHFPDSDFYSVLRPRGIFFCDPYFWMNDASSRLKEKRNVTFRHIVEKTNWPVRIYIPAYADFKFIKNKVAENKNIEIFRFSSAETPNNFEKMTHFFWDTGFFTPAGYNVLSNLVFSCIRMGYGKIYIYGADMSFHEDLYLDQITGRLEFISNHFYGKTKFPAYSDWTESSVSSVSGLFHVFSVRFACFDMLSSYAKKRGVILCNSSSYSWIDSFERVKPVLN